MKQLIKRKNFVLKIAAFALVMGALAFMMASAAASGEVAVMPVSARPGGQLTTFGTGSISVEPDIAHLNISVVTRGPDTTIQRENSEAMDRVIAAVRGAGVEESDIQTVQYSIWPEHDWSMGGRSTIVGYVVTNSIRVTVREIERAGEILALAEQAGANEIGGISFATSTPELYYRRALELAVADSIAKAEVIARAAGVTLGDPVSITEGSMGAVAPLRGAGMAAPMVAAEMAFDSVSIATGEIIISANVTIIFGY